MHSIPSFRVFPSDAFETEPVLGLNDTGPLSSFPARKIVERFLFPRLSPQGDRWCNVLGFVPKGSFSSSSTPDRRKRKPLGVVASPASLSARSSPLILTCLEHQQARLDKRA